MKKLSGIFKNYLKPFYITILQWILEIALSIAGKTISLGWISLVLSIVAYYLPIIISGLVVFLEVPHIPYFVIKYSDTSLLMLLFAIDKIKFKSLYKIIFLYLKYFYYIYGFTCCFLNWNF